MYGSNAPKKTGGTNKRLISLIIFIPLFLYIYQIIFERTHAIPNLKLRNGAAGMKNSILSSQEDCEINIGEYTGPKYVSSSSTLSTSCLVQSKWMKLMKHSVRMVPNGAIMSDWLFVDYHDRVNVLVERPNHQSEWMIFRQRKYAIDRESYAIVGGIIEFNEEASDTAAREIAEEMNVKCKNLKSLGTYRTDVNRGMGWVHSFVATECMYIKDISMRNKNIENTTENVGVTDLEDQNIIMMSTKELQISSMKGEFLEVQWSNTVALALLHLQS